MKITEYTNDLDYNPPPMLCDKPLSEKIKEPLPRTAHFMSIIGAPGSGKSSLMLSMLTHPEMYKKVFHNIYVVVPKNSRDSMPGEPFKDHPPEKLFDELTFSVLDYVENQCKTESVEKHYSLLILDDCAAELKKMPIENMLKRLVWNRRHLRLSIWILSQSYISIPLSIRKAVSHLVMFRPRNKKETEALFSELLMLPKEQQESLVNHIFPEGESHGFLFLDTNNGKIHKRFNYLQIE